MPNNQKKQTSNRCKSNNSDYNRIVWCDICKFSVRAGGHEARCRKNGPNRKERRMAMQGVTREEWDAEVIEWRGQDEYRGDGAYAECEDMSANDPDDRKLEALIERDAETMEIASNWLKNQVWDKKLSPDSFRNGAGRIIAFRITEEDQIVPAKEVAERHGVGVIVCEDDLLFGQWSNSKGDMAIHVREGIINVHEYDDLDANFAARLNPGGEVTVDFGLLSQYTLNEHSCCSMTVNGVRYCTGMKNEAPTSNDMDDLGLGKRMLGVQHSKLVCDDCALVACDALSRRGMDDILIIRE